MIEKIFLYDNASNQIELNTPEILLISEFAMLMKDDRNKCKADPKGKDKLRAFREFQYIYLAIDWCSPYCDYPEQERHQEALKDSHLTESEFNNPEFRAACRKYKALQESNRSIKLLHAAQDMVDKFIDYFHNVDPEERNPQTGKPIFQVKNLIAEITKLDEVHEELQILESRVKKQLSEESSIRGGAEDGFIPQGF